MSDLNASRRREGRDNWRNHLASRSRIRILRMNYTWWSIVLSQWGWLSFTTCGRLWPYPRMCSKLGRIFRTSTTKIPTWPPLWRRNGFSFYPLACIMLWVSSSIIRNRLASRSSLHCLKIERISQKFVRRKLIECVKSLTSNVLSVHLFHTFRR